MLAALFPDTRTKHNQQGSGLVSSRQSQCCLGSAKGLHKAHVPADPSEGKHTPKARRDSLQATCFLVAMTQVKGPPHTHTNITRPLLGKRA